MLSMKRDVLSRFVGHRCEIVCSRAQVVAPSGESFVALNEGVLAYADDKCVLDLLRRFQEIWLSKEDIFQDKTALITAMARSAKVPVAEIQEDLLMKPLLPNSR